MLHAEWLRDRSRFHAQEINEMIHHWMTDEKDRFFAARWTPVQSQCWTSLDILEFSNLSLPCVSTRIARRFWDFMFPEKCFQVYTVYVYILIIICLYCLPMSTVCITFTYIHNHSHVSLCIGAQGALCSRWLQSWIDQFVARFVPHWRIRLRPALGFASDPSCAGRLLCFAGEDPGYSVKANIESRGAGSFGRQGRSSKCFWTDVMKINTDGIATQPDHRTRHQTLRRY